MRSAARILPVVTPGFVDLHVHGFGGFDPLEDISGMSLALARAGTTAFQPTLFPAAPSVLGEECVALQKNVARLQAGRARARRRRTPRRTVRQPASAGALPAHDLCEPSHEALRAILGSSSGDGRGIRTMTVAPELAGSKALIEESSEAASVRRSATVERRPPKRAAPRVRARAARRTSSTRCRRCITAKLGLAGFALTDGALFAEIIGDLAHVGAEAIELALRARSPRGLCLVSDALSGAGTGCDVFHSHGREHRVREGTAYYPPNDAHAAPRLAGSAMSQLEMVRRLTQRGVVGLTDALAMASETPARALGLENELGALRPGLAADFLVLRGAALEIEAVYVAGLRL